MGASRPPVIALDDAAALHYHRTGRSLLRSVDIGCRPRRSSSYHRLPQQLVKLCVVKLDGTSFEVQVSKSASISDLKVAVEQLFKQPSKECHGGISWTHVWGHFCLSYEGIKLVNDKFLLRAFGIKDGDQLYFIRHHLSLSLYKLRERPPQSNQVHQHRKSKLTGPQLYADDDKKHEMHRGNGRESIDNRDDNQENQLPGQSEFQWAHLMRGWLSYTKLWRMGNRSQER